MPVVINGVSLFVGATLSPVKHSVVRMMSDVWDDQWACTVWYEGKVCSLSVPYNAVATPDPTPEVNAAIKASIDAHKAVFEPWDAACKRVTALETRREEFKRGDVVRIVRGRKLPIGSEHTVSWSGTTRFGKSITVFHENKRVYVSTANVEHADWDAAALDAARAEKDRCQKALDALGSYEKRFPSYWYEGFMPAPA